MLDEGVYFEEKYQFSGRLCFIINLALLFMDVYILHAVILFKRVQLRVYIKQQINLEPYSYILDKLVVT